MKKILLVTDAWEPQVNGVVVALSEISHRLEARGFEVVVVHPGLFRNIPLPLYPEIRLALFPKRKLQRMFRVHRPDYIHIATEGPLGHAARRMCLKEKFLFTSAYHTHFPLYLAAYLKAPAFVVRAAYRFLARFHNAAAATMVHTESVRGELQSHGFTKLVLWPAGVDTNLFVRNSTPALPPLSGPVFAYFGRITKEKSVEEFLSLSLPGTKLVIGDGPDRVRLERKYGHEARFVGYKKGKELVDWLSLVDVAVIPSRTETFGLVIIEALACGIPVAAHDAEGPRDIIDEGVDGFLSEDLKEAALACLPLSREKCREKALRYSWEHSTDVFISNLESQQTTTS